MKGTFVSVLSILVLLLAGCDAATPKNIHTPVRLFVSTSRAGMYPAAAVGKDGTKYFAWSVCASIVILSDCDIYVNWTIAGEPNDPVIVERPAGATDMRPDITVTDNGTVYLVWERNEHASASDCWATFDPGSPGPVTCRALGGIYGNNSGDPKIASYGNTVYAVYGSIDWNTGVLKLRYRQLNPLDRSGGWMIGDSRFVPQSWAVAVSSADTLHAAWVEADCSPSCAYYMAYGNNRFSSGDMYARSYVWLRSSRPVPVIGVAPLDNNRVYVACGVETNLGLLTYAGDGGGDSSWRGAALAGNWTILGDPSMAISETAGSSHAYIAFAAREGAQQDYEIYVQEFNGDPAAYTNNNADDVAPKIAFVKEGSGQNTQVLAWWVKDSKGNYAELYEKTGAFDAPQVIYAGPSVLGSLEMAGNGPWVAGVWDFYDKDISRPGLMITFNVHQMNLPLIMK